MSTADDERTRRLAAIEARLNPQRDTVADASAPGAGTPGSAGSAGAASSGTSTPLFGSNNGPPRNLPKAWKRPTAREELERRREVARILNRTIVRDSGYRQAAECVETLLKIATNIQGSSEEKFRTLKSDNTILKNKVLSVPGGREYMVTMGFHTETRNFVQFFILDQSQKRMYELGLAADVLRDALPSLQERLSVSNISKTAHKAEEAARVAAAKRQIEEDRELVRDRTERERMGRMAHERALAHAHAHAEAEAESKGEDEGDEDDDEEEPSVPGYTADRRWGHGQKLGE
ncbi:uncharacterized protein EHS24_006987 [Apiotrichum porosum]|uniref:PUB domain-containing protein n=1 Tax=Apiotrichum porosum TaxID=105984 RepID=A0A427XWZ6_9TREE|nr:uncharacterized protein EHS24_006987 [Apiotrichum porosum]RSH83311.1 hypothetical protein EHS24_006987 [Apiotrichum porosum]